LSERYIAKADRHDDILANAGVRIGGNDFDRALSLACFMPLLGMGSLWGPKGLSFPLTPFHDLSELSKIQCMYTKKYKRDLNELIKLSTNKELTQRLQFIVEEELGHSLMACVEDCKINLSSNEQTLADLSFLESGLQSECSRNQFEDSLYANLTSIMDTINACVLQAGITTDAISLVILTGGGTAMPLIKKLTHQFFPHAEIADGNRLSSVGFGLACDAKRYYLNSH
jgi:hypothetical chaperone protein